MNILVEVFQPPKTEQNDRDSAPVESSLKHPN
jgi:hypothetical protein